MFIGRLLTDLVIVGESEMRGLGLTPGLAYSTALLCKRCYKEPASLPFLIPALLGMQLALTGRHNKPLKNNADLTQLDDVPQRARL